MLSVEQERKPLAIDTAEYSKDGGQGSHTTKCHVVYWRRPHVVCYCGGPWWSDGLHVGCVVEINKVV